MASTDTRKNRKQWVAHMHTSDDKGQVRATASSTSTATVVAVSNGAKTTSSLTRKARYSYRLAGTDE